MSDHSDHKVAAADSPVLGIDVFNGDGEINWAACLRAGRRFAWIKATEGGDFRDVQFDKNREGAHAAGVIPGAYHFFRPKTDVKLQIENFCDAVGSMRPGELPPAFDLEVPEQWRGVKELREQHLADWREFAMEDRMKKVLTWLEAVEKRLGMRPCVYASPSFIDSILGNDPRLAKYRLWLANYTDTPRVPAPWSNYTWHQYSEHGKLPEVTGHELDFNRFDGTLDDLKSLCYGGSRAHAEPGEQSEERPWYGNCPFIRWILRLLGR